MFKHVTHSLACATSCRAWSSGNTVRSLLCTNMVPMGQLVWYPAHITLLLVGNYTQSCNMLISFALSNQGDHRQIQVGTELHRLTIKSVNLARTKHHTLYLVLRSRQILSLSLWLLIIKRCLYKECPRSLSCGSSSSMSALLDLLFISLPFSTDSASPSLLLLFLASVQA